MSEDGQLTVVHAGDLVKNAVPEILERAKAKGVKVVSRGRCSLVGRSRSGTRGHARRRGDMGWWPFAKRGRQTDLVARPARATTWPARAIVVRAKFDSAQTTADNRRHWANADGLSADVEAAQGIDEPRSPPLRRRDVFRFITAARATLTRSRS